MKNIDRIIYGKLFEITILMSVIMISFPLWKTLDINEDLATAAFYNEVQFSYLDIKEYPKGPMFPMSEEDALSKLKSTKINVVNDSRTREDFALVMRVKKDSSLDYHCLNIALDDKVKPLADYYFMDDIENYYFVLTSDSIEGETKNYDFKMWMDASTGNEMQGKTLSYAFEIQKNIVI